MRFLRRADATRAITLLRGDPLFAAAPEESSKPRKANGPDVSRCILTRYDDDGDGELGLTDMQRFVDGEQEQRKLSLGWIEEVEASSTLFLMLAEWCPQWRLDSDENAELLEQMVTKLLSLARLSMKALQARRVCGLCGGLPGCAACAAACAATLCGGPASDGPRSGNPFELRLADGFFRLVRNCMAFLRCGGPSPAAGDRGWSRGPSSAQLRFRFRFRFLPPRRVRLVPKGPGSAESTHAHFPLLHCSCSRDPQAGRCSTCGTSRGAALGVTSLPRAAEPWRTARGTRRC